jgi:hypothetical protein
MAPIYGVRDCIRWLVKYGLSKSVPSSKCANEAYSHRPFSALGGSQVPKRNLQTENKRKAYSTRITSLVDWDNFI